MARLTETLPRLTNGVVAGVTSVLVACVRVLPVSWFGFVARLLSWLLWPLGGRLRRRLQRNVERIQEIPSGSAAAHRFQRQVVKHQCVCALETIRAIYEPELLRVEGFEELQRLAARAEAEADGPLYITGHTGSWELMAYFAHRAGKRPLHVLAKSARLPSLTRTLGALRARMGARVLWADNALVLRDMLRTLRNGGTLGLVMDQRPKKGAGPRVEFWGFPTEFVKGPAAIAIRTRCAVIAVFCMREGPFRYRLLSYEVAPPNHEETDEVALTQRMAHTIERVIRIYPEQWTWMYRRWRFSEAASPAETASSPAA